MTKAKPQKRKKVNFWEGTNLLIILSILVSIPTILIIYKAYAVSNSLISIGTLVLIAGMMYEYQRLSQKWQETLFFTILSLAFSFMAFLPGKNERTYILEDHIFMWPFVFCFMFLIFSAVFHEKKITPKLTEGITLLQSIALIYWVLDVGLVNIDFIVLKLILLIGLAFSLFSIFQAFSPNVLSQRTRLTLSIWSSFIMIVFGIDNIISVYRAGNIEAGINIFDSIILTAQYFLLGISSIYIFNNYYMLSGFLPGKGEAFTEKYKKELREHKKRHLDRYSAEQVNTKYSLLCVIFSGAIFGLNKYYEIFPRNFIIWSVFITFPILLHFLIKPDSAEQEVIITNP